jgi:hypothetical protein
MSIRKIHPIDFELAMQDQFDDLCSSFLELDIVA